MESIQVVQTRIEIIILFLEVVVEVVEIVIEIVVVVLVFEEVRIVVIDASDDAHSQFFAGDNGGGLIVHVFGHEDRDSSSQDTAQFASDCIIFN